MMMFIIGLFIGANVGLFVAALCFSLKQDQLPQTDEPRGGKSNRAHNDQPHGEVVIVHHPRWRTS